MAAVTLPVAPGNTGVCIDAQFFVSSALIFAATAAAASAAAGGRIAASPLGITKICKEDYWR